MNTCLRFNRQTAPVGCFNDGVSKDIDAITQLHRSSVFIFKDDNMIADEDIGTHSQF